MKSSSFNARPHVLHEANLAQLKELRPKAATADKGRQIFEMLVEASVPVLQQLSMAKNGDFPYVVRKTGR